MNRMTIVVGSGMAGIMATRTLHDAGIDVLCLEGRDRIGGRTHTDTTLGPTIDLGGSWIHGPTGNPLTSIARSLGIGMEETDFVNQRLTNVMAFDSDGNELDVVEYSEGLQYADGALKHMYGSVLRNIPNRPISLAELYALGFPGEEHLTPTQKKGLYYSTVIRTQYSAASDLAENDAHTTDGFVSLPGGDLLLYGGGFKAIVDHFAAGLDIQTGVTVQSIRYGNSGVTLHTSHGDFTCQHVIVTVPVGVLQAGAITFEPALPEAKQAALDRMGYGNYEKIALRFPYQFWPSEPQRFNYLTNQTPELYTSWLNNAHFTGEPILVAYHAGSRAQHINQMSDGELIEGLMGALEVMFGDRVEGALPSPTAYVRTNWEGDPFSRGSYTFGAVGSYKGDRAILGQPIDDRVFFAGEATHPNYWATVHGAYETGIRAAREVLNALNSRLAT